MKLTLKLEELAQFILSIIAFNQLPFAWWWFPALILLPDISMIGYLINPKIGAILYNIGHHKAIGILIYLIGMYLGNPNITLTGIILFGHSSMDRFFGYGLKYPDSFHNTHLGTIGNKQ